MSHKSEVRALKWAVFVSGEGTNLQALLEAQPKIDIALVISSRPEAPGVARAHRFGIPVLILPKSIHWGYLSLLLESLGIQRIFLAGFMKLLPSSFIDLWEGKILNLHPSLLPAYKGLKAMERSYEDGASMGVTVHWVTSALDDGPIWLQQQVFEEGAATAHPWSEVRQAMQAVEQKLVVEAVRRCEEC